jgi:hypothetical protein
MRMSAMRTYKRNASAMSASNYNADAARIPQPAGDDR